MSACNLASGRTQGPPLPPPRPIFPMDDILLWQARAFIYKHFVDTARPPSVEETARHLGIAAEEAASLFSELHRRHAIYLEMSIDDGQELTASHQPPTIRMANPFSGFPTEFKVHANGKTYFANCAWDMLGIPATLHSDAAIDAPLAGSDHRFRLEIQSGRLVAAGRWCIFRCRSRAGTMTWFTPERPCCSSGRRSGWIAGVSGRARRAAKCSRWDKSGNCRSSGMRTDSRRTSTGGARSRRWRSSVKWGSRRNFGRSETDL